MKKRQKEESIKLRKMEGLSIKEIAEKIGVSKGSVSRWVRNVELTSEQHQKLQERNPIYSNQLTGKLKWIEKHWNERSKYQNEGRIKAKENNKLHSMGCMLYWAEGDKARNCLGFTNSDVFMVKFFLKFLRECYNVKNDEIVLVINCYSSNNLTFEEIKNFWLSELGLSDINLRKCSIDAKPTSSSGLKIGKVPYGTCRIKVNKSTKLVQSVFGAIQEYANFENKEWIN